MNSRGSEIPATRRVPDLPRQPARRSLRRPEARQAHRHTAQREQRLRVRRSDVLRALERLQALLEAGLSTSDALTAAGSMTGTSGRLLQTAAAEVRRGRSFSAVLEARALCLCPSDIALLRAGERGGMLAGAVALLHERLRERAHARSESLRAVAYPAFLLVCALASAWVLSVFVLPAFAGMYAGQGAQLPTATRRYLALGELLQQRGLHGALTIGSSALLLRTAGRSSRGFRLWIDGWTSRTPVLGRLLDNTRRAAIYGTVGALLRAGCDAQEALRLAAATAPECGLVHRLHAAVRQLGRGGTLSHCWRETGMDRPGDECALLEIAEATGDYAGAFTRLAGLRRGEHEQGFRRCLAALEPAAIALLGIVVGTGVLAVYEPILGSASMMAGRSG